MYLAKAVLTIVRGLLSVTNETCQLMVGEHLTHLPCRYHQLLHCEVSHHGTSVKVQYVGTQCKVPDV